MTERKGATSTFTRGELEARGFEGFTPVADLRATGCAGVPARPGVYVVLREREAAPRFLRASPAGLFKDRDPTVDAKVLRARWVPETPLLYIGKATSGRSGATHLQARVSKLVRFGAGRPIGHWGGRYIWQLQGSAQFVVAWRIEKAPTSAENTMLAKFLAEFGSYPFANIAGPRGGD